MSCPRREALCRGSCDWRPRIYIHADDHAPPHFHVVGPDTDLQVAIKTLQVMRGCYRAAYLAQAITWAAENQALLRAKWNEYNERD